MPSLRKAKKATHGQLAMSSTWRGWSPQLGKRRQGTQGPVLESRQNQRGLQDQRPCSYSNRSSEGNSGQSSILTEPRPHSVSPRFGSFRLIQFALGVSIRFSFGSGFHPVWAGPDASLFRRGAGRLPASPHPGARGLYRVHFPAPGRELVDLFFVAHHRRVDI